MMPGSVVFLRWLAWSFVGVLLVAVATSPKDPADSPGQWWASDAQPTDSSGAGER